MPINIYKDDPRWIKVRKNCECSECNEPIKFKSRAFFYPATKAILCAHCGMDAYELFKEAAEAEYAVTGAQDWFGNDL